MAVISPVRCRGQCGADTACDEILKPAIFVIEIVLVIKPVTIDINGGIPCN
ncbi:hypothetical protein P4S70_20140 [Enterovibrio sp. Hal110]